MLRNKRPLGTRTRVYTLGCWLKVNPKFLVLTRQDISGNNRNDLSHGAMLLPLQHSASLSRTDSLTALDVRPGGVQLLLRTNLPDHHQQVEAAPAEYTPGPQPVLGIWRTLVLLQHGEHLHGNSPQNRRRERLHRHDNCRSARAE